MINYCKTCGWANLKANVCSRTGLQIDPAADFCSKHTTNLFYCDFCGNVASPPIIDYDKILCSNCNSLSGTCAACKKNDYCAFEEDPDPMPRVISREIQRGPIITVAQVPNPERIEKFCKPTCPCFDPSFGCSRQYNTCYKYVYILEE